MKIGICVLLLLALGVGAAGAQTATPAVAGSVLPTATSYQAKLVIQPTAPCGTAAACAYDVWRTDGSCSGANADVATWQKLGATKPNVLVYLDPTIVGGKTYCYAVESDVAGAVSDPSNFVEIAAPSPLPAPVVQGTAAPQ
jgi:hypothetical protein